MLTSFADEGEEYRPQRTGKFHNYNSAPSDYDVNMLCSLCLKMHNIIVISIQILNSFDE